MVKLPLYEAVLKDEIDGIFAISLVDLPATEVNWVCFNKDKKPVKFAIDDNEEHVLAGVIMLADTPIYRIDNFGYEYNIIYHKETIKAMAQKMLADNAHNQIDLLHDGNILPDGLVQLQEIFIKDEANGINPSYFADVPDGSLLAKYKINDPELWELCKNGELHGFSLAGYFSTIQEEFTNKKHMKKDIINKIQTLLKSLLVECAQLKTDKAILCYDGDIEQIDNGVAVTDPEGNTIPDGDYTTEGGKVITVTGGTVANVADPFAQPEQPEAQPEDPNKTVETQPTDEQPAEEKPEDEKPAEEQPTEEKPAEEQPEGEQKDEQPANEKENENENPDADNQDTNENPDANTENKDEQPEEVQTETTPENPDEAPVVEEQPAVETPVVETPDVVGAEPQVPVEQEVASLKAEIESLKQQLADVIAQPAVEPIAEQFQNIVTNKVDKQNKAANIASYLNS